MADQLATPEDLASALQQTDLDRATCELLIEAATAVVQALVGWRIVEVTNDEVELLAPVGTLLQLPGGPVTSVLSVTLDGVLLPAGTASGTYRRTRGGLYRDIGWASPYGPTFVNVVRTHGYAEGRQELQLGRAAVLSLAKGAFTNPSGVYSEKIDDYAVAYEKAATAMDASPFLQKALLRQYGPKAGFVAVA